MRKKFFAATLVLVAALGLVFSCKGGDSVASAKWKDDTAPTIENKSIGEAFDSSFTIEFDGCYFAQEVENAEIGQDINGIDINDKYDLKYYATTSANEKGEGRKLLTIHVTGVPKNGTSEEREFSVAIDSALLKGDGNTIIPENGLVVTGGKFVVKAKYVASASLTSSKIDVVNYVDEEVGTWDDTQYKDEDPKSRHEFTLSLTGATFKGFAVGALTIKTTAAFTLSNKAEIKAGDTQAVFELTGTDDSENAAENFGIVIDKDDFKDIVNLKDDTWAYDDEDIEIALGTYKINALDKNITTEWTTNPSPILYGNESVVAAVDDKATINVKFTGLKFSNVVSAPTGATGIDQNSSATAGAKALFDVENFAKADATAATASEMEFELAIATGGVPTKEGTQGSTTTSSYLTNSSVKITLPKASTLFDNSGDTTVYQRGYIENTSGWEKTLDFGIWHTNS